MDDKGVHLYETDPSGAMMSYKAGSIGSGRSVVMEIFEEKYKTNISMDEAIKLGLEALMSATEEGGLNTLAVEIGVVRKDSPFQKMEPEKVTRYMDQSAPAKQ